jgi:hypothetical protein
MLIPTLELAVIRNGRPISQRLKLRMAVSSAESHAKCAEKSKLIDRLDYLRFGKAIEFVH